MSRDPSVYVPTAAECDMRRKARHERSSFDLHLDRIAKEQPVRDETAAKERTRLLNVADAYCVPRHLAPGLVDYVVEGLEPGDFLRSCLANDALTAIGRADTDSRAGMGHVAAFIAHHVPVDAKCSYERVHKYAAEQRARRRVASEEVAP